MPFIVEAPSEWRAVGDDTASISASGRTKPWIANDPIYRVSG